LVEENEERNENHRTDHRTTSYVFNFRKSTRIESFFFLEELHNHIDLLNIN